jgi:hypothetical protein
MKTIKTSYVFPPIPDRSFDWIAYYDGHEEDNNNGFGKTEKEAIQDLKDNCQECGGLGWIECCPSGAPGMWPEIPCCTACGEWSINECDNCN